MRSSISLTDACFSGGARVAFRGFSSLEEFHWKKKNQAKSEEQNPWPRDTKQTKSVFLQNKNDISSVDLALRRTVIRRKKKWPNKCHYLCHRSALPHQNRHGHTMNLQPENRIYGQPKTTAKAQQDGSVNSVSVSFENPRRIDILWQHHGSGRERVQGGGYKKDHAKILLLFVCLSVCLSV